MTTTLGDMMKEAFRELSDQLVEAKNLLQDDDAREQMTALIQRFPGGDKIDFDMVTGKMTELSKTDNDGPSIQDITKLYNSLETLFRLMIPDMWQEARETECKVLFEEIDDENERKQAIFKQAKFKMIVMMMGQQFGANEELWKIVAPLLRLGACFLHMDHLESKKE